MAKMFNTTAYQNLSELVYGTAKKPITLKNGMVLGGGTLYPEINFTLPSMHCNAETWTECVSIYKDIITGICNRARALDTPGFVAEIETLPPMTQNPEWCVEICKTVVDVIKEHEAKYGIKGAVKITPNDNREGTVEHMYRGPEWDNIFKAFEGSAKAGADFLCIESLGGKEVHDEAVMYSDIVKSIYALSVLGCSDMEKLWTPIVGIAKKYGTNPGGDTACGFANTSLALAEENYIPRVFAALVRVLSSIRSIVAVECGATGLDKDCGYEGPYLKAISGIPIAMEGKTAACAHLSRLGNIAMCMADVWSNESIQHIKLLGGYGPTVSFEMLTYDCRLANEATKRGFNLNLRDMLADSDSKYDPQAYILRPDVVLDIAKEMVKVDGYYPRAKRTAAYTIELLQKASKDGKLDLNERELMWLDTYGEAVAGMPNDPGALTEQMIEEVEAFDPKKYDM
jgi:methanol--5-hydroxybenzimidazolylcobamide Co-methyltransferase